MLSPQNIQQSTGSILKPEIPSGNALIAHANLLSIKQGQGRTSRAGVYKQKSFERKGIQPSLVRKYPSWDKEGSWQQHTTAVLIKFSRSRPVVFLPSIRRHNITQLSLSSP